jgi:cobalt transporter subunit CbtA
MFRRLVFSAAAAGLFGALVVALFQYLVTTPLILEAEVFEHHAAGAPAAATDGHAHGAGAAAVGHGHDDSHAAAAAPVVGGGEAAADDAGVSRHLVTAAATVVVATGMMLILLGLMVVAGIRITPARALGWGLAGFVAAALAPALGLPPELPGMPAADLEARQLWWVATVGATAFGLWAILVRRRPLWIAAGLLASVLPHAVGAPQAASHASEVPAALAAQYVAASLTASLLLWTLSSALAGYIFARATDAERTAPTSGTADA